MQRKVVGEVEAKHYLDLKKSIVSSGVLVSPARPSDKSSFINEC
jgi:hypothetical protein